MEKQLLLSKQGIFFRTISLVLQLIVTIPLFLLLSFIASCVIIEITDSENVVLIFKIVLILFNLLWLVRNSIVTIYSDRIILRDCIGAKKIIETENITDLRIISYKELRHMIFKTSSLNPLISNCAAFFIPMGKFITFKNKFNRDVVIGVWNYKKLYDILCKAELSDTEKAPVITKEKAVKTTYITNNTQLVCFLKMPLKMHILTFFKNFYETLLLPAIISSFFMWRFNTGNIYANRYIGIAIFLIISAFRYYKVLRVVVNTDLKVIKLNLFLSNNKNVIKYENLYDLSYAKPNENLELLKMANSDSCIVTPYNENNISQVITFKLKNDISVALSVNKPQELYELIKAKDTEDGSLY